MTIPDPMAALKASLPPEKIKHFDRMEALKAKFYPTDREDKLAEEFHKLIAQAVERPNPAMPLTFENRSKGRGLALHGPTRVGKTTSLDRMLNRNDAFRGWEDPRSDSPLLSISLPSPCTSIQIGRQLVIAASGLTIHGDPPAHKLFEVAGSQLVARKKVFLRINELQHATHEVSDVKQQVLADALKSLMEDFKISLIVNGVETLLPFLELDGQLLTRLTLVPFPPLAPEDLGIIEDMVGTYADEVGVTVDTGDDPDFYPRISHGCLRALGLSIEMTRLALADCLKDKTGKLTRDNYADVYAARTGAPASRNPFLADRWPEIDCSKILPPKPTFRPESPSTRKPTRK